MADFPVRKRTGSGSRAWIRRVAVGFGAVLLLTAFPDAAAACPVCFDASDENRMAFLATTAFLSLLPLGMVAGAGLYLRRRARELDDAADGRPAMEADQESVGSS